MNFHAERKSESNNRFHHLEASVSDRDGDASAARSRTNPFVSSFLRNVLRVSARESISRYSDERTLPALENTRERVLIVDHGPRIQGGEGRGRRLLFFLSSVTARSALLS